MGSGLMLVVIRFQICIFDTLNTAYGRWGNYQSRL